MNIFFIYLECIFSIQQSDESRNFVGELLSYIGRTKLRMIVI